MPAHKYKVVLHLQTYDCWGYTAFQEQVEPGPHRPVTIRIPEHTWMELGKPEKITVSVTA